MDEEARGEAAAGASTHFVLIHGSWHGAWCWEKVTPLLEAAGHVAVAVDLPGHGEDTKPPGLVSLSDYTDRICEVVEAQSGPVVLVGHSMGGGAITQAAEHCAERLRLLVYLAAFVPRNGMTIAEQAMGDPASLLTGTVLIDPEAGVASLSDDVIDACFYGDCKSEDIAFARCRLRDDPLPPLMTPLVLSGDASRDLPRIYIECSRDATLTPEHQRAIRADGRWAHVYHLDTGHSPFLSAPERLAGQLLASLAFAR